MHSTIDSRRAIGAALALAAAGGLAGPARADDVVCPPSLGAVTIDGNVLATGTCRLEGTRVIGNVFVYPGGSLAATSARIDGNIQSQEGEFVRVDRSSINGSVQLDRLRGASTSVTRSFVGGSIQVVENRVAITIDDNDVGQDVQAFANTAGVDITNNVIDGNLQCKENRPAPTGGFNRVGGNKEDQCANLQLAAVGPALGSGALGSAGGADAAVGGGSGGGGGTGPFALALLAAVGVARRLRIRTPGPRSR